MDNARAFTPFEYFVKKIWVTSSLILLIVLDTIINIYVVTEISNSYSLVFNNGFILILLAGGKLFLTACVSYLWRTTMADYSKHLREVCLKRNERPASKIDDIPRIAEILDIILTAPKLAIPVISYSTYILINAAIPYIISIIFLGLCWPLYSIYRKSLFSSVRKMRASRNKLTNAIQNRQNKPEKQAIISFHCRTIINAKVSTIQGTACSIIVLFISSLPYIILVENNIDILLMYILLCTNLATVFSEIGYFYESLVAKSRLDHIFE